MLSNNVQGYEYWRDRDERDPKMDWKNPEELWIRQYWYSMVHPHREVLLNILMRISPFDSLLEIGCSCGSNIYRIRGTFPLKDTNLAGIDANVNCIEFAKSKMGAVDFRVGDFRKLPYPDKSFDIVLSDAALMYVSPEEIEKVMKEIDRVARVAIVLIEWSDKSRLGIVKDFHWARDYMKLLEELGYGGVRRKFTLEEWPSENWLHNGILIAAWKPTIPQA